MQSTGQGRVMSDFFLFFLHREGRIYKDILFSVQDCWSTILRRIIVFLFLSFFSLFFREVREEIFDSFHSEGSFHHDGGGKQGNHGCPGNWYLRLSVDGRKCFIKVTVLKCSELGSLGEINILRFLGDGRYFMNVFFFFFFLLSLVLHTSFDLTPFIQVPEASAR